MKAIKSFFLHRRNLSFKKNLLIRTYPLDIQSIGIISIEGNEPDTNFITKLKNGFEDNIQIHIFVLNGYLNRITSLSLKDFDFMAFLKMQKNIKV